MIFINGKQSTLNLNQFDNLEEVINLSFANFSLSNQIITNVIVDDEPFSEIYPHQAEDISCDQIGKIEIFSLDLNQMALNVIDELFKVTKSMELACETISIYLRQGDNDAGLDMLQDLIDVQRSFLNMVGTLRTDFNIPETEELNELTSKFSDLLSEVLNVMGYEDWILLADFLSFEVAPNCKEWNTCLTQFKLYFTSSKGITQ